MIYFDNAATTPLSAAAQSAASDILDHIIGNASSPHAAGLKAERTLRLAADRLAYMLGCLPDEIIFTSGGTESNNMAILGTASRFKKRGGHILSTPLEHPSVTQPLRHLSGEPAGIDVVFAPVSEWATLIRPDTFLVSFSHVGNETGDINDIARIAARVKQMNPDTWVHVDGAQGFCKEAVSLAQVDMYSFSAHKVHGPQGVGGLMVRRGVRMAPLMYGGGQQAGLRPGTENVPGIAALAAAAQQGWDNRVTNHAKVAAIRSVIAGLAEELPDVFINQSTEFSSPYILNMSFIGVKGDTLVNLLSGQGIYIATGAACRSRKSERSPLFALDYAEERVMSAVRFSFSPMNTVAEAEIVKQAVWEGVRSLRQLARRG